jgi:putative SOS response-associated peptidase YedK
MCARFTYKLTWAEIVKLYRMTLDAPARNTQTRYNICPTTPVDVIVWRWTPLVHSDALGAHSGVVEQAAQGNEARHV